MKCRIASACCLLALLLCPKPATSQEHSSERPKPQWLHKLPKPTNPSFMYETVSASASTLDEAREKCLVELIAGSGLRNGIVAISSNQSSEQLSQVWQNGKLSEKTAYDSKTTTYTHYEAVRLHVEEVAEYWTRNRSGDFFLTKLYAKSELGTEPLFDNLELTTRYGARGLWRSAIIPGWGQFYKGAYLKGGIILGGCALLVGGSVFLDNQRSDYARKIARTHNQELINSYSTQRDHFAAARNVCIGAAVALYVYNLIDAIAAPGARRIVVTKRPPIDYTLSPVVNIDGSLCMLGTVRF